MATPRISVITPSYNQARFLERAICSVLDQGYQSLEYLIADGGSDDGSAELIRMYEDELAWSCSQPDAGPVDAINRCLDHATGDLVLILNANDVLLPGALDRVAAAFAGPDAPAWVSGRCLRMDGRDETLGQFTASAPESLVSFLKHDSGMLPGPSTVYRRDVLEAAGRLAPEMRDAYRYELSCRLLVLGHQPGVLKTTIAGTRETDPGPTAEQTLRRGEAYIDVAERHAQALPMGERYVLWKNCNERRRIYALASAETKLSAARRHLWQQLLRRPWWLASDAYRRMLLHGVAQTSSDHTSRKAA